MLVLGDGVAARRCFYLYIFVTSERLQSVQ